MYILWFSLLVNMPYLSISQKVVEVVSKQSAGQSEKESRKTIRNNMHMEILHAMHV